MQALTKYVGGHSDVVGGAVVVRDLELADKVGYHQNAMGAVAGPFDSFLTLRGLKTLAYTPGYDYHQAPSIHVLLDRLGGAVQTLEATGRAEAPEPAIKT